MGVMVSMALIFESIGRFRVKVARNKSAVGFSKAG